MTPQQRDATIQHFSGFDCQADTDSCSEEHASYSVPHLAQGGWCCPCTSAEEPKQLKLIPSRTLPKPVWCS